MKAQRAADAIVGIDPGKQAFDFVNCSLRAFSAQFEQASDIRCRLVCEYGTNRPLVQAFSFVSADMQEILNLAHLIDAGDPTVRQDGNFAVDCSLLFENDLLYCLGKLAINISRVDFIA